MSISAAAASSSRPGRRRRRREHRRVIPRDRARDGLMYDRVRNSDTSLSSAGVDYRGARWMSEEMYPVDMGERVDGEEMMGIADGYRTCDEVMKVFERT